MYRKKVYDFYKGAWICFYMLSKQQKEIRLDLPREFPLWREGGEYASDELTAWFHAQAEEIGRRFDTRNGSHYFAQDLSLALVKQ